jgi:hypothetical protein
MSRPPLFFFPLLLGLAALGASPVLLGDETENLRQLQAMPRERRVALSENLERFDKLDPAEQAAIRKLDAEIARKVPLEQARYRAVLRRYHLWVNSLSAEEKAQLKAAEGTEARFNLARKFRMKEIEGASSSPKVFGIRTGDLGVNGPYEIAHLLKIWKALTPGKKVELERNKDRLTLLKEIRGQGKNVGVAFHPFPQAEEKHYDDLLDGDEAFKKLLGPYAKRVEAARKKADAQGKGDAAPRPNNLRFAEFLYFETHKPKAVSQANLERFSAWCPNWLHEMLDPLSPDDARAYLTILYRLLYPHPDEMPVEKPAKAPADAKSESPKSTPKKSGPAGPI